MIFQKALVELHDLTLLSRFRFALHKSFKVFLDAKLDGITHRYL